MREGRLGRFAWRLLAGICMGVGAITPGVSGGVMAVAMGLYEPMIVAVSRFFRDVRGNVKLLLPIGLGACVGVLAMSNLMRYLMARYAGPVLLLFIGLVAGSTPALVKEGSRDGFSKSYLWAFAAGAALLGAFALLERAAPPRAQGGQLSFAEGLLCGGILSVGVVIPGVSTSFLLIYMGMYAPFMAAISALQIWTLVPIALGFGAVSLALVHAVRLLFARARAYAYFAVLGFTAGSVVLMLWMIAAQGFAWWHLVFLLAGLGVMALQQRRADHAHKKTKSM
nr:DUF368 domain-containing protein [Maliibacterium massiliense]